MGILSTQPIDKDASVPWGIRVADSVMAPYHQHLYNVRIDPAVGSRNNSFMHSDSVRLPRDKEMNPLGTGYQGHTGSPSGPAGRQYRRRPDLQDNQPVHPKSRVLNTDRIQGRSYPVANASCPAGLLALEAFGVRRAPAVGDEISRQTTVSGWRLHEPLEQCIG